jgi:predicted nucleic acid-binding protein
VVLLDTSAVIGSFTAERILLSQLRVLVATGEPVRIPALVIYEWLRGPRTPDEIADQEELFPSRTAIMFGLEEAVLSAKLYNSVRRARSREIDIAVAACAVHHKAELWTLNSSDFADIPGLRLFKSR